MDPGASAWLFAYVREIGESKRNTKRTSLILNRLEKQERTKQNREMSSTRTGIATVSALARQAIQPCTCGRAFSSSAKRAATVLKAEKLDKGHDPLDMNLLEEFGHDDLPARAHRIIEHDREKLHLLRLVQFQLPEIKSSKLCIGIRRSTSSLTVRPCRDAPAV